MQRTIVGLLSVAAGTFMFSNSALAAEPSKPVPQPPKHVVAAGESLSSIAEENKLATWRPIWNANSQLANPDQINPGDVLAMPTEAVAERQLPAGYGEPAPRPVAVGSASTATTGNTPRARVASSAPSGDIFARIRARESGGNYATNTGNGYYGAYQYNDGTWGGYGGYLHASDAPAAVQDAKAQQTYAARGCSPWPSTCY